MKKNMKFGFYSKNIDSLNMEYLMIFISPYYSNYLYNDNFYENNDALNSNQNFNINNFFLNRKNKLSNFHIYYSDYKKIQHLGGINQILPILEIMFSNNLLLDNQILVNYLNLIKTILSNSFYNFINANENNFFECLSIFLEKIPKEFYSNSIAEILISINEIYLKFLPKMNKNKYSFLKNILINTKIIFKINN